MTHTFLSGAGGGESLGGSLYVPAKSPSMRSVASVTPSVLPSPVPVVGVPGCSVSADSASRSGATLASSLSPHANSNTVLTTPVATMRLRSPPVTRHPLLR